MFERTLSQAGTRKVLSQMLRTDLSDIDNLSGLLMPQPMHIFDMREFAILACEVSLSVFRYGFVKPPTLGRRLGDDFFVHRGVGGRNASNCHDGFT